MQLLNGPEFLPRSGKKPKHIVILLHGLGADGNDLISMAPLFAEVLPDAYFISPNAPFNCDMAPYGYQWFSMQSLNPYSMERGLSESFPYLDNFITHQLNRFKLSSENIALVGFSQGTMMSLYYSLVMGKKVKAILGYSGALIGSIAESDSYPQVCLVHGFMDNVVPFVAMLQAEAVIKENGIEITTHRIPGLYHGINDKGIEIGKRFLEEIL